MQERSLGAFGTMTVERAAVLLPETGAPPACRRVSPLRTERPEPAGRPRASRVDSTTGAEANDYVANAAAGDVSAFEHLYRTHLPRVHSLVRRMSGGRDADELHPAAFPGLILPLAKVWPE